ncbi:MAG: hypothetical protein ACOC5T_05460 [Elusimicrobiota bacterium]
MTIILITQFFTILFLLFIVSWFRGVIIAHKEVINRYKEQNQITDDLINIYGGKKSCLMN